MLVGVLGSKWEVGGRGCWGFGWVGVVRSYEDSGKDGNVIVFVFLKDKVWSIWVV